MQNTTRMLRDALEHVAPVGRHAIVIGEALRNGGLLDVPTEREAFRAFVETPLRQAARSLLGKEQTDKLVALLLERLRPSDGATLTGTLPLAGESSKSGPPSAPRGTPSNPGAHAAPKKSDAESTLPYAGDEKRTRLNVALIEPDNAVAQELTELLEHRDYRVLAPKRENLAVLCRQIPIRIVMVGAHFEETLATVQRMGDGAPLVVFVSDAHPRRPAGVSMVLPRKVDAGLVEALDIAVRYGQDG